VIPAVALPQLLGGGQDQRKRVDKILQHINRRVTLPELRNLVLHPCPQYRFPPGTGAVVCVECASPELQKNLAACRKTVTQTLAQPQWVPASPKQTQVNKLPPALNRFVKSIHRANAN